jgi:hypothetical protein
VWPDELGPATPPPALRKGFEGVKKFESVMLSAAKHLCSSSQVLEPKATAEILRCAQDDSRRFFHTFFAFPKDAHLV